MADQIQYFAGGRVPPESRSRRRFGRLSERLSIVGIEAPRSANRLVVIREQDAESAPLLSIEVVHQRPAAPR